MSFKSFPVYRLEELIGAQTLEKVSSIIPVLDPDIEVDTIYQKSNLVKILHSFFNSSNFSNIELRREFLSLQKHELLNEFCDEIGIPRNLTFDEKVSRVVSKGWKDKVFCELFCNFFDLPENFIPENKIEYPNHEFFKYPEAPFKVLKEYQASICFKAIKQLEYRNSRFILQMPTGSGKTRTAMDIISDSFKRNTTSCYIFWLVYSEELCEQAVECFKEVWSVVGTKNVKVVRAWGNNALNLNVEDKFAFIVGGFQKLFNQLNKDPEIFSKIKDKTYLIIVDEAHRVLAPTYKMVTDSLFGLNARLIGLTATPGRGINNEIENKKLSEYFNEEKLEIQTPKNKSVFSYLKGIGVMSYVDFQPLTTSPSFSLGTKELTYLEKHFDFPPSFLRKIGENEIRNFEIIKELLDKLKSHNKALFFGCSVEHSKFICSMLNFIGINAAHVDGSTDKGARQSILKNFKSGDLRIICNYGILSTGFDAPKTDLVFIARPTQSIVLYSQMIGRGLRGKEVGGTESCTVITVKDNITGLPSDSNIFTYFDDYFDH